MAPVKLKARKARFTGIVLIALHFADEGYINADEVKDYLRKRIKQENLCRHSPA